METTQKDTYATKRENLLEMVVEDSLKGKIDYEFGSAYTIGFKLHP